MEIRRHIIQNVMYATDHGHLYSHTEDEVPALMPYIANPRPTQYDVGTHITVCLVHLK